MNIKWCEQKQINDLESWAEVNNYHIDDVIAENANCLMYASYTYRTASIILLKGIVLYDKVNKRVFIIYYYEKDPLLVSEEAHKLQKYAFRQFDRLRDKLIESRMCSIPSTDPENDWEDEWPDAV